MKTISIENARATFADTIEHAQSEPVVLTRHGKPVAIILGAEHGDPSRVIADARHLVSAQPKRRKAS